MRNRTKFSESGFVVVIALIALMAMSFFLLTGAATTTSAVKVSGNYSKTIDIFNMAEAGLAKARPMIENQEFDTVLATYADGFLIAPSPFNGGTYEVTVANDLADPNGPTSVNDGNGIIKLTSIGRGGMGGRVTIETHVQLIDEENPVTFPPDPATCSVPGCDSAALLCGTDTDVLLKNGAVIDGSDYAVPPFGCTGNGCDTTYTSGTDVNLDIVAEGNVDFLDDPATAQEDMGTDAGCDQWQTFYDQWASVSTSAPGVVLIGGSLDSYSGYNSCDTPKVFLINTSAPVLKITGNSFLCGTFIVASPTSIELAGTITLVGVVLMMGSSSNITYEGTVGTSNLFGKMIFKSTTADAQKELSVKGDANVLFSSAGVGYALEALNNADAGGGADGSGRLLTVGWEESYD